MSGPIWPGCSGKMNSDKGWLYASLSFFLVVCIIYRIIHGFMQTDVYGAKTLSLESTNTQERYCENCIEK